MKKYIFILASLFLIGCTPQNTVSAADFIKLSEKVEALEAQLDLKEAIEIEYPTEEIEECNQELGEGAKVWSVNPGIYNCGCKKGYAHVVDSDGDWSCKKLDVDGETYCVEKYGSRWTMSDLYGSCDCKSGYIQSDDGSFRCFLPVEMCIYSGQTGEECLNSIMQLSDMLYRQGKFN